MSAKELNIGDYVRTKGGNIFKIVDGNIDNWEIDIDYIILEQTEENWYESNRYNDNGYWFNEKNIIKSSPNIIDLIEVGDILKFKDTKHYEEVEAIDDDELYLTNFIYMSGLQEYKEKIQNDLEWVITHEQIESMKYEVR